LGGVAINTLETDKVERRFLQTLVTKNFYTLRVLSGLSTSELADLIGTTRQSINSIENGKTERMNGTMLTATKAVLLERANNNKSNRFELSLLKHILTYLFNITLQQERSILDDQDLLITDAFLAVAKLSEAGFSEEKLERLSEAVLKTELLSVPYKLIVDTDETAEINWIDETTKEVKKVSIYEEIGLGEFFYKCKKANNRG
jgi:transcriptional regulator with XRE-family HTH domain